MTTRKVIRSTIVAAAIAVGCLTQIAYAAPSTDQSLPPAAGGGWHDSEAFAIWMAAVRNLRYTFGFSF